MESSSSTKRKDAAASIEKAAGGKLLDLIYLHGDHDMAAPTDYVPSWTGLIEVEITAIMDDKTISGVLGKKFG